ncbi:MAG: hypothetical protein ACREOF_07760 [Gemmatimonadales bacterium]
MSLSIGDPHDVLDQYEALRREATETMPGGPRGHGLAVFLTCGMPGWLAALTALAPAPRLPRARPAPPPPEGRPTILSSARAELTTVLAGMVLACTHETEGR